jgi:hypothetical protein
METEFKVQDCVQLMHNKELIQMVISKINESTREAVCHWISPKTNKGETHTFPLNVLKHCPRKLSPEEHLKITQKINQPRSKNTY